MTYPVSLLVHQANLQTGQTVTTNAYGSVGVPTYTAISCRFGLSKTTFRSSESGDRVLKTPVCIVPADTVTKEGDIITGLTSPYLKTYRIKTVNPAMIASVVSHLVLDLETVS